MKTRPPSLNTGPAAPEPQSPRARAPEKGRRRQLRLWCQGARVWEWAGGPRELPLSPVARGASLSSAAPRRSKMRGRCGAGAKLTLQGPRARTWPRLPCAPLARGSRGPRRGRGAEKGRGGLLCR